ncbi:MAG: hypothetical protein GTO54_12240 [Nitrososphaeria archaeon]|nr:hypothetical protein [Nitrososphaeria archaeon]
MSSREIDALIEVLKRELERERLQNLELDPREEVEKLLRKGEEILRKEPSDVRKGAIEKEKEILGLVLKSIENLRLEKVFRDFFRDERSENMLPREVRIYEALAVHLEEKVKEKLIVALKRIPAFVGVDGKEYGPFEPGDVALIHEEDFKTLSKEGLIKQVEVEL